jgi:hypothetical protein
MSIRLNYSSAQVAVTVAAAALLGQSSGAQVLSTFPDPLSEMRTNRGEELQEQAGETFSWHNSPIDSPRPTVEGSYRTSFYPPPPPALGEEMSNGGDVGRLPAAHCLREVFYAPYASLLYLRLVSRKDTDRVAAYRSARDELVHEIQTRFEELRNANAATRAAALTELARQQDNRLQALAEEAEVIRSDLAARPALVDTTTANSFYQFGSPALGGKTGVDELVRKSLRLFDAAFHLGGLSIEQRELLFESAYEGDVWAWNGQQKALDHPNSYLSFLPATARIQLPSDLSPSLESKINAFVREKEALKNDLNDAVLREDYLFPYQETRRLAALAKAQEPRMAALDTLAEEIRIELAGYGWPDQPGPSALPADLTRRVGDFCIQKAEFQKYILSRLRQLRGAFPNARFDIARQGNGLAIAQTGGNPKSAVDLTDINSGVARRYSSLAGESEALRRDIQRFIESGSGRVVHTVDQLAADFAKAYAAQVNWNRYRDYFHAVLVPGLSSAQRRLLFQYAAEDLYQAGLPPES